MDDTQSALGVRFDIDKVDSAAQPIAPESQSVALAAAGEMPLTPAPAPGPQRLKFIIGRSPITADGATLTVQRSRLTDDTVSLPLDALRLVYIFFPEEYKWHFVTPSEYQHRYVNLDALSEDDYAALQIGIAAQHHVLTDRCHFVLADYGGQMVIVSQKELRTNAVDLLQELRRWRAERYTQRAAWPQQAASVTIGASLGSLRGAVSLNVAGVGSGSRLLPWSALERVEITRYSALWETCFFRFVPTKASRLQGISTGVAPRFTEACLAEFDFWRTLATQAYPAVAPLSGTMAAALPAELAAPPAAAFAPPADPAIGQAPGQPTSPGPRRAVFAVLLASLGVLMACCLIAAVLFLIARPDTQPPGQAKATEAPALAVPAPTSTSVPTGDNAPTQLVFVGANPIIALAAGPDDTLYAVTTANELLKLSPDGKPETLHVSQKSCGFSFSSVVVVGDSPITNDCIDNKDVLIRIDPDGRKTTLTTLEENLTALASDPTGQVVVGTWTSEGNLSMNFQPSTYLTGAEDIRGHVSVLATDGRLEPVYEGGIPLALAPGERGALAAAIWGQAGRLDPEATSFSMCGPARHLWIALSDQARLQSVGPVGGSDALPKGGWPGAFTLATSAPNGVVFAFGNLPDEPCGIYRFAPGKAPQRLAFDGDLAENVTALSASISALYFADGDGNVHKASLDVPGVAVSDARPLPVPTATGAQAAAAIPLEQPTPVSLPTDTPMPTPTVPVEPAVRYIPLAQAINEGLADIQILGMGGASGASITLIASPLRDEPIFITVEPGTILRSSVPGEQDMVVRRHLGLRLAEDRYSPSEGIVLPGLAAGPQTHIIDAYCLNFHKDNPSSTTSFSADDPASQPIVAILDAVDRVPGAERSIDAIQAAIWRVTDHATWQEMADRGYAPNHQMVAALLLSASLDQECALLFGQACAAPPCSSPTNPTGLGASGGQPCVSRVWQADAASFTPTPEPTTTVLDAQIQRFFAPGPGAVALTVAGDTLWIADKDQQRIHHLDQAGASLGSFSIEGEGEPRGLAWDGEALWLLLSDYSQGNRLLHLDTQGNVLASFPVPIDLKSLSWNPVDRTFWAIPSQVEGFLLELNADGSVRRTLDVPVFGRAEALAWAPDGLWVLNVFGTWHRFTFDGDYLASAKLPVEVFASYPALAWDPRGYLWLSVPGTREIYQFSLREAAVDAEPPSEMQSAMQPRSEGQFPLPPVFFRPAEGSTNAIAQVVNGLPATLAVALDNDQGGAVHESAVLAPGESWSAIVPQGGVFTLFLSANAPQPVAYSDKVLLLPGYEYTWTVGDVVASGAATPTVPSEVITPAATPTVAAPAPAAKTATPTPRPPQAAPSPTVAPTKPPALPPAACQNPRANVTSPANGASISGITPFIGTANLDNLAYYKFEYKPADSPTWQYLTQVNEAPISNGKLMDFYTTTIAPGVYDFRLIVVDRTGNYPPPCELRLTVQ